MPGITWLASYPKSGNTWLRIFFNNLQRDGTAPADINELNRTGMGAADRDEFDRVLGFEALDLTNAEIDLLRPKVYRYLAEHAQEDPFFCKVHDAYAYRRDGEPLIPLDATAGAIYLIRNPLDVCVSYAHHCGISTAEVVALMAKPRFSDDPDLLRQRLWTWSGHVRSWLRVPNLRILVLRYEDMKARPLETFTAAAAFVGMTVDQAKIAKALGFSSMEELQRQESERGFNEAAPGRPFFRQGKVGGGRAEMTEAQVLQIIDSHGDVMRRFGYLRAGELVF